MTLSPRQREVLQTFWDTPDARNANVAAVLGVQTDTVKNQLNLIRRNLGLPAGSRKLAIVKEALKRGEIKP